MEQLWWCSFCCCLVDCYCCWLWWWWWSGWGGWTCVATGWGPMLETGNVVVLSLCVGVPCPVCPVLKTLCLAVMWWLLSQCRYWSVWTGFLYTVVLNVLSGSMVTRVSKNGSEPCVGSTVNCMCGSWLLVWWSRSWLCSALLMTKVSSTNLSHREGDEGWN